MLVEMNPFFSIYIHIPFCRRLCDYCHFYRIPLPRETPEIEGRYLAALLAEARWWADQAGAAGRVPRTVYFGGGDPALFSPGFYRELLAGLDRSFPLAAASEVSAEAGGDAEPERVAGLVRAGIGRLSLGAVSFERESLTALGRRQDPGRTAEAAAAARSEGVRSLGLDLVYAFEGQTMPSLSRDLGAALRLAPEHISLYALQARDGPGTGRGPREAEGDLMAAQYREARRLLLACGHRQYEISNFALPGHECLHKLNYWADGDYLGLGPGAHGSLTVEGTRTRYGNREDLEAYLADPGGGREVKGVEKGAERAGEALMLALRTTAGADLDAFRARYGVDPLRRWGAVLREFSRAGLVRLSSRRLRLSTRGMLLSNELFQRII
jgi:oxygen-independent coproporphyrinogen-3 oxidase